MTTERDATEPRRYVALGSALEAWQRGRKLTDDQCGTLLGVDQSTWTRYRTGTMAPRGARLLRLGKMLGMDEKAIYRLKHEASGPLSVDDAVRRLVELENDVDSLRQIVASNAERIDQLIEALNRLTGMGSTGSAVDPAPPAPPAPARRSRRVR